MTIRTDTHTRGLHWRAEMFNRQEENRGQPLDFPGFAGDRVVLTGVEL